MATALKPISTEERAKREDAVRRMTADLRIEGLELDADAQRLYSRYVEGELTLAEVASAMDRLNERDYGYVRLPRD